MVVGWVGSHDRGQLAVRKWTCESAAHEPEVALPAPEAPRSTKSECIRPRATSPPPGQATGARCRCGNERADRTSAARPPGVPSAEARGPESGATCFRASYSWIGCRGERPLIRQETLVPRSSAVKRRGNGVRGKGRKPACEVLFSLIPALRLLRCLCPAERGSCWRLLPKV